MFMTYILLIGNSILRVVDTMKTFSSIYRTVVSAILSFLFDFEFQFLGIIS